jgi:hypothetical protein
MKETYYAGSYWLARHETAEACARRAEAFFRLLSPHEPTWSRWHQTADSFEQARKRQITPDAAAFKKVFGKKSNRIGDGFTFWLWAGDNPEETTSAHGFCGSSDDVLSSSCVLKPPTRGAVAERVLTASVLTEVVRAMATAWEPEWAVATSNQHLQSVRPQFAHPGTFVGWVMYFSRQRGPVPPLPAPVRIEPVEDKGTLVVLTPERFSVSNPEHFALAARVHELLGKAGLLQPILPR